MINRKKLTSFYSGLGVKQHRWVKQALQLGKECCALVISCGGEVKDVIGDRLEYALDVIGERLEYASVGERLEYASDVVGEWLKVAVVM